jgi:myo-inositol-1(or 4)-monophosphatase
VDVGVSDASVGRLRSETEIAIRAAGIAQKIADSRTGADGITSKGGIDLVTNTDLACEDAIRIELLRAFPDWPVVGEEREGTPQPGKPYWLVDPICGTRSFASNIPLYCTNIALVEDGEVTLAAVGIGTTGEILWAEKGRGAQMRKDGADRLISATDSSNIVWLDGNTPHAANAVCRTILSNRWFVWKFSSTLSYAYVACGRIAAAIQFSSSSQVQPTGSVHTAAGCFIAREAGATVTDVLDGSPWQLGTRSFLIAATPKLHRELSEIVDESRPEG